MTSTATENKMARGGTPLDTRNSTFAIGRSPVAHNFAITLMERFSAAPPSQRVSDWVAENIVFNEPEVRGPFDFTGRQYLRQPLDDNNDTSIERQGMCFATGLGKTIVYMAGVGYKIVHRPQRGLWVMPATNGANGVRNFNNSRLRPMLEASPAIARHIPRGADRFRISGLHLRLNGMVIDFAGANSPGQLTGNRCGEVRLDEVDKFKKKLGDEAGATYIAETRTDGVIGRQMFQSSTPTIDTGPIWTSLLSSNLNRRFVPCPHCGRHHPSSRNFVMVWSEQFTILPGKFPDGRLIPVAQVTWDPEAARPDGTWDMDRVIRSAHATCPHCGGHIHDSDIVWMDEQGQWIPTARDTTSNRHAGYHLPRMYAPRRGFESTFGGMAKKFLENKANGEGMRGFINSDLAEPDVTQEFARNRIEIINETRFSTDEWCPLLTVDVQQTWPYFWFVVRKWSLFTMLPPFAITTGKPDLSPLIAGGASAEVLKKLCDQLVEERTTSFAASNQGYTVVAELLRFCYRTDDYPLLQWCIGQNLTGARLVNFYHEHCHRDTFELGRHIYRELKQRMPRGGDSEAIAAGHCDTWDELREIPGRFGVGKGLTYANAGVMIDSGFGAYENAEVMRNCFAMATQFLWRNPSTKEFVNYERPDYQPFAADGWLPCKGFPSRKRWTDTGVSLPWRMHVDDPFKGTSEAGQYRHYVFEYAAEFFMDKLADLRGQRSGYLWAVAKDMALIDSMANDAIIHAPAGAMATGGSPVSTFRLEDYWRHLDGMYKDRETGKWCDRGRKWPTHLHDCERMQPALAAYLGIFSYDGAKHDNAMTDQPKNQNE